MPNVTPVQLTLDAVKSILTFPQLGSAQTQNAVLNLRGLMDTKTEVLDDKITELELNSDLRLLDSEERDPNNPPHPTWAILFLVLGEKAAEIQQKTGEISDLELATSLTDFLHTLINHKERYETVLAMQPESLTLTEAVIKLRNELIQSKASINYNKIQEVDLTTAFQALLKGTFGRSGTTIGKIRQGGEEINFDRLQLIEILDNSFEWVNQNLADLLTRINRYGDAEALLQALIGSVEQLELNWRFPVIGLWLMKVSKKGDRDFLNQRPELTRAEYARVASIDTNGKVIPSPEISKLSDYYAEPKKQIAQILSIAPKDDGDIVDGNGQSRFDFSAQAISALQLIIARLGLISGIAPVAPIWRFDYLYQLATFFAQQAEQAEQRYIQFEEKRINGEITRQQLSDAVSAARNELSLAETRIRENEAAVDIAQERQRLASNRQDALSEEYFKYISNSSMAIQYQAIAASLGGGSSGVFNDIHRHIEELRRTGQTRGERGFLIGASSYLAGMEMREVELARMQNAIDQAGIEVDIARKQLVQERIRRDSSIQLRNAVLSRYQEARALERLYENQDLTSEVYRQLAQLMQRISFNYLSMAYEIAYLAEMAFNYEFRSTLSVITAPDDATSKTRGLLQSEILKNQLASFKLREVYLGGEERIVVTWNVSLHELFPTSYVDAIIRGRPFIFTLDVTMLDKKFPGLVDVRIENLQVEVSNPYSFRISNGFYAQIRQKNPNDIVMQIQNSSESLSHARDSTAKRTEMVLQQDNRKRLPFEGSSPFCAWRFQVIDDQLVNKNTQTKMIFQLSGIFSQDVFDHVMEQRKTEERLLPIVLSDLDSDATEILRSGQPLRVTLPFSIPSENGVDLIQLFPPNEGTFPLLTGLQAVVGLSDAGASPTTLSAKIKLPFSSKSLNQKTMSAEGGVAWPDEEIPADQPAVGKYEITFEGHDLEKLSGAALLLRYKLRTFREGYSNTLIVRSDSGVKVKLIFQRTLLEGTWAVIHGAEELARISIIDGSSTVVNLNFARALGGGEWASTVFRHLELKIDISLF